MTPDQSPYNVAHRNSDDQRLHGPIISDWRELNKLANDKRMIFSLACQRRFQSISLDTAKRIQDVSSTKGDISGEHWYLNDAVVYSADGYWELPTDSPWSTNGWFGGKLNDTGYHLVDLTTWLMRCSGFTADAAEVHVVPTTPRDSAELVGQSSNNDESAAEINIGILVEFLKRRIRAADQYFHAGKLYLNLAHEGASKRKKGDKNAYDGRAKCEIMLMMQGQRAFHYHCRIAKFGKSDGLGSDHHCESVTVRAAEEPKVEPRPYPKECDEDEFPAREFFHALGNGRNITNMTSSLADHGVGISIMQAAYKSMAQRVGGRSGPIVFFTFDEGIWQEPSLPDERSWVELVSDEKRRV